MDDQNTELAEQTAPYASNVLAMGGAMQAVRTQHVTAMAVQRPRNLINVIKAIEQEAELSGELFYYGWGSGKDRIEGASVKLANACFRHFGNCSIEMGPVQDLPDSWIFTAYFIDLETGSTLPRQFRQSKKWVVYGKHDEARKEDIRFQIGQSKALRNLILNAVPHVMVHKAMEAAMSGVRKDLQKFITQQDAKEPGTGLAKAVDMVMTALLKRGVSEERILAKLGVAGRKAIDLDQIIIMRGDVAAIDREEAKPDEIYPKALEPTPAEALKARMKGGKGKDAKEGPKNGPKLAEGEVPNDPPKGPPAKPREREPGEDDEGDEGGDGTDPLVDGLG